MAEKQALKLQNHESMTHKMSRIETSQRKMRTEVEEAAMGSL